MSENIHTTFDKILNRADKEKLLGQKGIVIWLTGLSGSGKTTIAAGAEKILNEEGKLTQILDGDNIRSGINSNLGFSEADREENIRRIAEVAKLFKECGVITFCCFVSPTNKMRSLAKKIIGEKDFVHVYVGTSLEECEQRDVKGLYAKARKGELKNFTGIDSPFEVPTDVDLEIETKNKTVEESVKLLNDFIKKRK
jgi:adenylylsulfate kinase